MKHHKPKTYQYRFKRGFFLFPKWETLKMESDEVARNQADILLERDATFKRFQFRKLVLQKLIDGKWVNI